VLSQALMESEVAGLIGAERHERTGERTAYRQAGHGSPSAHPRAPAPAVTLCFRPNARTCCRMSAADAGRDAMRRAGDDAHVNRRPPVAS
jgi:hypothetical protein